MATHDLGIALAMLGRVQDGSDLVAESMRLAREAGDRALLARCYINLPSMWGGNGEPRAAIEPVAIEGLDWARHTMDHGTRSWIAVNLADFQIEWGDLAAARAFADEGLEAAIAIEYQSQIGTAQWRRHLPAGRG